MFMIPPLQTHPVQPQRVDDDRERRKRHRRPREHRREQRSGHRIEHPGGHRHPHSVEHEREEQVLANVRHRRARQTNCPHQRRQVAAGQRDPRALDGHIGSRPHRHADIGRRQRGGIVDPVAGHRHARAPALEFTDNPRLVLGPEFGMNLVDPANRRGNGLCRSRLSPVSMTIRRPCARKAAIASRAVSRIGSATATSPAARPSTATSITPPPCAR
jgi:hypothetical protein